MKIAAVVILVTLMLMATQGCVQQQYDPVVVHVATPSDLAEPEPSELIQRYEDRQYGVVCYYARHYGEFRMQCLKVTDGWRD